MLVEDERGCEVYFKSINGNFTYVYKSKDNIWLVSFDLEFRNINFMAVKLFNMEKYIHSYSAFYPPTLKVSRELYKTGGWIKNGDGKDELTPFLCRRGCWQYWDSKYKWQIDGQIETLIGPIFNISGIIILFKDYLQSKISMF